MVHLPEIKKDMLLQEHLDQNNQISHNQIHKHQIRRLQKCHHYSLKRVCFINVLF